MSRRCQSGLQALDLGRVEAEGGPEQLLARGDRHRGRWAATSRAHSWAAGRTSSAGSTRPASPSSWARWPSKVAPESRTSAARETPDHPGQHPVRPGVAEHAAAHLHDAVRRVGRDEADVALEGEGQPDPSACPLTAAITSCRPDEGMEAHARGAEAGVGPGEGGLPALRSAPEQKAGGCR